MAMVKEGEEHRSVTIQRKKQSTIQNGSCRLPPHPVGRGKPYEI